MSKALIIGSHQPWVEFYQQVCAREGIETRAIDPTRVVFEAGKQLSIIADGHKLTEIYDYIIPLEEDFEDVYYSVSIDPVYGKSVMLNKHSIRANPQFSNKFHQYQLIRQYSDLQTPTSYFSVNTSLLAGHVKPHASIAKMIKSSRGRGVFELPSQEALIQLADEFGKRMLVQDYIKTAPTHSYRTLVLGGKSLGTVKSIAEGSMTTNGAHTTEQVEEPGFIPEFEALASTLQLDLCGIDYVVKDGQPIIFEINRFPYFESFTKTTGIDVAARIIAYLQQS